MNTFIFNAFFPNPGHYLSSIYKILSIPDTKDQRKIITELGVFEYQMVHLNIQHLSTYLQVRFMNILDIYMDLR